MRHSLSSGVLNVLARPTTDDRRSPSQPGSAQLARRSKSPPRYRARARASTFVRFEHASLHCSICSAWSTQPFLLTTDGPRPRRARPQLTQLHLLQPPFPSRPALRTLHSACPPFQSTNRTSPTSASASVRPCASARRVAVRLCGWRRTSSATAAHATTAAVAPRPVTTTRATTCTCLGSGSRSMTATWTRPSPSLDA